MSAPKRYRQSAGILVWRRCASDIEVLLGHPGGPFWAHKDAGAWTIPKGEFDTEAESPLEAAQREFAEETGFDAQGDFTDLGTVRMASGKLVFVFGLEADFDASAAVSNLFELEWPPHSGKIEGFPEVDRAQWFQIGEARTAIMEGQLEFLERLEAKLGT
jgi:predicted NUDIX family NTP pyrophosphohydrolase